MMKQKEFISVVTAFAALLILSTQCTRPQKEPLQQSLNQTETSPNPRGSLRAEDVATNLATEQFNTKDFVELAGVIALNVEKGYDEKLYLSDLMKGGDLRNSKSPFLCKLRDMLSSSELRGGDTRDNQETELSLYWMNSREWNKQERPTIAYVTEDTPKDAKEIPGIITNDKGEVIKTIMVNEEYAKTHPTVIVNKSPKPEGTPIAAKPQGYKSPLNGDHPILNPIKRFYVKTLFLGKMQATKQYDPWIDGGSEFYYLVEYPINKIDQNGNPTLQEAHGKFFVSYTRNEISNGVVKDLDFVLVSSWNKALDNIGFVLYEDDSTWAPTGNIKFSFTYQGYGFTFEIPVPATRTDLYKTYFSGDFLMSGHNYDSDTKDWKWHNADGVKFTLPIKYAHIFNDNGWNDFIKK